MEVSRDRELQDGPHLVLQNEEGKDTFVALTEPITIGRRTSNAMQILDPTVSREHVRVSYGDGSGWVEDLGSTHGTFVNDIRVTARQELSHNDRLRLGRANSNTMIFRTHREFSDLMETAEDIEPTAENLRNLWALLEISKALNSSLRLDDVLEKVIEAVLALTRAERGMLLLLGKDTEHMEVKVQRNFDPTGSADSRYSSTVVNDVVTTGEPTILTDAAQDERFSGQESIVGLNLRTVDVRAAAPRPSSHRAAGRRQLGSRDRRRRQLVGRHIHRNVGDFRGWRSVGRAGCRSQRDRCDLRRSSLTDALLHRPGPGALRIVRQPRSVGDRERPLV